VNISSQTDNNYRDSDAIGCLMVGLEIGWLGSWVPYEPGRHVAAWSRGRREHYGDDSDMDGRPVVATIASLQTNWCHLICSSCLWHFIWKASMALASSEKEGPGFSCI